MLRHDGKDAGVLAASSLPFLDFLYPITVWPSLYHDISRRRSSKRARSCISPAASKRMFSQTSTAAIAVAKARETEDSESPAENLTDDAKLEANAEPSASTEFQAAAGTVVTRAVTALEDEDEYGTALEDAFTSSPVARYPVTQEDGDAEVKLEHPDTDSVWDLGLPPGMDAEEDTVRYLSAYREMITPCYEGRLPNTRGGPMGDALTSLHRTKHEQRLCALGVILRHLERMHGKDNPRVFSIAMAFVAAHGFIAAVLKLLKMRRQRYGTPKRAQTFAPLLHALAVRGRIEQACHHFDSISSEYGLTPDLSCWNALLRAYCEVSDVAGAAKCFEDVKRAGLSVDSDTFTPLLSVCGRTGDLDGVRELLSEADSMGVLKTLEMYRGLVHALARRQDVEMAERFASELLFKQMPGSYTEMWNDVLYGYARTRRMRDVVRVFRYMCQAGVSPNSHTYTHILYGLIEVGSTRRARWFFDEVLPRAGVKRTSFHYGLLMGAYAKAGRPRRVTQTYNRMRNEKIKPARTSNIPLLKASAEVNKRTLDGNLISCLEYHFDPTENMVGAVLRPPNPRKMHKPVAIPWTYTKPATDDDDQPVRAHMELLMNTYGRRPFTENIESLKNAFISLWGKCTERKSKMVPPLRLLHAMMAAVRQHQAYDLVDECWQMALDQAAAESRSLGANPGSQQNWVSPARQRVLNPVFKPYIDTLAKMGRTAEVLTTVKKLLWDGYDFDAANWNTALQLLIESAFDLEVFRLCEEHLMPGWTGWGEMKKSLQIRHAYKVRLKQGLREPSNETLELLSQALTLLTRQWGGVEREPLRTILKDCPRTLFAIRTMPYNPIDYARHVQNLERKRQVAVIRKFRLGPNFTLGPISLTLDDVGDVPWMADPRVEQADTWKASGTSVPSPRIERRRVNGPRSP